MSRPARPLIGGALAFLAAACSPLTLFNTLVPKDGGVTRIVTDAPFGPDARQRLDVYAPVARKGPLPVILFLYGGAWSSGVKEGYAFVGRALAARGYVVAIPDYRLVPQFRYPTFLEDNAAAARWVLAHAGDIGGEPNRLILAGHSAGAYNAAMLALDPRWLGKNRHAITAIIGLAGPYDFLPLDGDIAQQTFGGVPDLPSTQPIRYVTADSPPAFLATAGEDETVRASNSDSLAAKLRAAGVFVERRTYPKVGHAGLVTAIARPLRYRAPVLDDMVDFLRRHTVRP